MGLSHLIFKFEGSNAVTMCVYTCIDVSIKLSEAYSCIARSLASKLVQLSLKFCNAYICVVSSSLKHLKLFVITIF